MLSPPPTTCQSPTSNMYSTCRALQSLLASNLPTLSPSPKLIRAPPHLGSPIVLTSRPRAQQKKTTSHTAPNAKITKPQPHTPPRSNLKRRRCSSPSDTEDAPALDHQNPAHSLPSTPKRQRTHPPTLPLGLARSDFDALTSNPATTPPHTPEPNTPHAPGAQAKDDESEWSTTDDSALVSLILNKLRLRQSDWDECARKLGKEKDSIGRRWKHLLGDGEVGLRRGKGGRLRGEVNKMEFGPPLLLGREEEK